MKVRLTNDKFNEHQGKVVTPNYIDDVGDANISGVTPGVDYDWAFEGEYAVVNEAELTAKYILTIPVQHLIGLHEILAGLPEEVLMSARITTN